jgi:hypothetical protein
MPNPFDDILAADLAFVNADVFADPDPVILKANDLRQYPFTAIVDRSPPTPIGGADVDSRKPFALGQQVWIPRALMGGRRPDISGDTLIFPTHKADKPSPHRIVEIVAEDGGGWLVKCR